ncbi:hypothetical protein JKP88DRAFT_324930 [Tribonema minus]|uniref:Uncharacterized protein n=1 Tax=Tribonema minus TaxID=303371 RepID=A0A835YRD3_9STRA|nr:hypothetical protein JKP88DRAFT_324930 [Tribonema minus]
MWYRKGFHQHCDPSALDYKNYPKTKARKPAAAPDNKGNNKKAAARKRAASRLRSDTAALEAAEAEKRKARYAASAPGKRRRIDTDRATAANDDGGSSGTNTPPRRPPRSPPSANGSGGGGGGDGRSGEGDDDRETNADSSGDEIIMMNGYARPASTGRRTGGAGSDGQPLADYIFNDGAGNKPPFVCRVEQAAREFTRLQEECNDARVPHVALCLQLSECVPSDGDFESLRTSLERQKECRRNLGAAEDELLRRLRELREVADKARNLLRTDGGGGSDGSGCKGGSGGKGGSDGSTKQNGSGTGTERDASKSTTDPNGADIAPAGSGAAGDTSAPTSNGAANNVDASLLSTGGSGRLDAAEAPRKRSQVAPIRKHASASMALPHCPAAPPMATHLFSFPTTMAIEQQTLLSLLMQTTGARRAREPAPALPAMAAAVATAVMSAVLEAATAAAATTTVTASAMATTKIC